MIITRFPPEPNGYLHLGHLKSMYLNFNYPKNNGGGYCLLRFDDTNPETEKQEYVDKIIKIVEWLEYHPYKITYTSDYFDDLYDYAIKLINKGYAYIDELSSEEISEYRRNNIDSPWRNRSINENLKLFNDMKNGKFDEDSICLRLKIDGTQNSSMQDPVAYRIKYTPHYKTKNKWCIYPSYDLSHCIIDSIEDITHSFCTLEFFIRRELYYWILEKLNLRKPIVKEFNRLETNFGILSKRKIKELVESRTVTGWDDPLLITLEGLKNKGYSSNILKLFCEKLGYTQNISSTINQHLLDSVCRDYLNFNAERCFGVLNPLKVTIQNYNDEFRLIERPINPLDSSLGTKQIILEKTVYIEYDDFRESANKKYFRLKPGKSVRLKYGGIITYKSHVKDDDTDIIKEVFVDYSLQQVKVKGTIHWTSENQDSKIIFFDYKKMEKTIYNGKVNKTNSDYLQFERLGYFKKIDDNIYHNLCSLKEDKNKN